MKSREPVVLLHGLIGTLRHPDLSAYLDPDRYAPLDLLGYGKWAQTPIDRIDVDSQVEHVRAFVEDLGPVRLVGHSVGGSIAMLFAAKYPERVTAVVNVEGNFTLKDAFWTSVVAEMDASAVNSMLDGYIADPGSWLRESDIEPTPTSIATALAHLRNQPGSTLKAMARSVIDVTRRPAYLHSIRRAIDDGLTCHLVAGARSREGWDVPEWILAAAESFTIIPGAGHMMMLERGDAFAEAVDAACS